MKPQPMIVLADVPAGSRWFQDVLGLASGHGGDDYEMLMDGDDMIAQLHRWETDAHPHLGDLRDPSRGNGIVLWFATDDFDTVLSRIDAADAEILDGPSRNENAGHREVWLRAPEGFTVVVAGPREAGAEA